MTAITVLKIAKGIGGVLASIAAEKTIEKIGKKIIEKSIKR